MSRAARADAGCAMVNRNAGSGTRMLIDKPPGALGFHPQRGKGPAAERARGCP
jgi:molybdate-binding protein